MIYWILKIHTKEILWKCIEIKGLGINTKRYKIPKNIRILKDIKIPKDIQIPKDQNNKRYKNAKRYEIPKDKRIPKYVKELIANDYQRYQKIWKYTNRCKS